MLVDAPADAPDRLLPEGRTFDAAIGLLRTVHRPHAHQITTRLPAGVAVHPVHGSLEYALLLLRSGGVAAVERAGRIIAAVAALQRRDELADDFGAWPWLAEEPHDAVPTDTNTACFSGAILAIILRLHADALAPEVRAVAREALRCAAVGIADKRPIRAEYTNIALLGAAAAGPAGELLGMPEVLAHARRRLREVIASVDRHHGFAEYNSPAYTPVAIEACEKILLAADDPGLRADAAVLREVGWREAAEHFHVGTGQWAGPISRTYHDLPDLRFLRHRVPTLSADAPAWALPVPARWAARFADAPAQPVVVRRLAIARTPPQEPAIATTWMDAAACLGSISCDSTTYQRRPLLGYWRMPGARPAVLRVRCLHDGHDFASGVLRCRQDGRRILTALAFASDLGDEQHVLDRPAQPVFTGRSLVLRIQLQADGADAALDGRTAALSAGGHRVVAHLLPARVFGQEIAWRIHREDGCACIDGELDAAAAPVARDLRTAAQAAGIGLELLAGAQPSAATPPVRTADGFAWDGLELAAPPCFRYGG